MKAISFQGELLVSGSHAFQLHIDGKCKELKQHLERLSKEADARGEIPLKSCRSPYCECDQGKCTHPGFKDARHEPIPERAK